jgi:hypothetical protein
LTNVRDANRLKSCMRDARAKPPLIEYVNNERP